MALPIDLPIEPMRARPADAVPAGEGWHYEPRWDGFRAIVARDGDDVRLQSRDLTSLDRYFPDLVAPLRQHLPVRSVVDGAIVIAGKGGLDFEALLARIHPAAARVALLAARAPAALVVWDLLALGDEDMRHLPFGQRRRRLELSLAEVAPQVLLTPATREHAVALDWLARFDGGGVDGVVAKRLDDVYQADEPLLVKVKRPRTADCVVGGFRWHGGGVGTMVGSLLLGLYDETGTLHHVGIADGFSEARRIELAFELAPLRERALAGHPWRDWGQDAADGQRPPPGGRGRSARGKDPSWEPLRPERVCEVVYDRLQGLRFRHATQLARWRPDRRPQDCLAAQLAPRPPIELQRLFAPALPLASAEAPATVARG
jgi:ATP-dependent DNA ligase